MNIKSTLLLGAAMLAGTSPAAFAQGHAEHAGASEANTSDIVVTGSRIRRTDLAGVGPATVVSAEQLENTGQVNIENVLARLPAVAGAAGTQSSAYWAEGGWGTAQVNLRGLGIKRTLTLLNGRRLVAGGSGANSTPDLNMIPVAALGRTEVLKDGASAIYGADAVAGVVNLVTRTDVEGVSLSARYGITGQGDGGDFTADFLWGKRYDRGGVMVAATYQKTQPIGMASRAPCALVQRGDSLACNYGAQTAGGRATYAAGTPREGVGIAFLGGDDFADYSNDLHGLNSHLYFNLVNPVERLSTGAFVDYELSDNVQFFGEMLFTKRKSNQIGAPGALRGLTAGSRAGIPIAANHPTNPTGQDIVLEGRAVLEDGPRHFEQNVETYQGTVGLRGKLSNDWSWEIAAAYGRNTATDSVSRIANLAHVRNTLDTSICSNAAGAAIPCADYLGVGDLTAGVLDYIMFDSTDRGGNELKSFTADLTGNVIDLPAGSLAFAAGLVYREEKGWRNPDARTVAGVANANQSAPVSGKVNTKEAYLEISAPILADQPFFKALTLDAAVRFSDYQLFGNDVNYKLGLDWQLNDSFRMRGTYGTGFRVPNVPELFSTVNEGNLTTANPCTNAAESGNAALIANCASYIQRSTVILTSNGGNRNLKPESSTTWTIGAVLQPKNIVPGLSLTADWFDIKIEDAVRTVSGSTKLGLCYGSTNFSHPLCADVERSADRNEVTYIRAQLTNTGTEKMNGLDIGLVYNRMVGEVDLSLDMNATWLNKYETTPFVGGARMIYNGHLGGGHGGYPEWRGYGVLSAKKGKVIGTWSTQFIGKATDFYASPTAIGGTTPNVFYHNAQLAVEVTEKARFNFGVDNLFDRKAPYVATSTDGNTDTMVYDLMGRRFYVGFRTGF